MTFRDFLQRLIDRLKPKPPVVVPPAPPVPPLPGDIPGQLLALHNSERFRAFIPALQIDIRLQRAAQKYADEMARNATLSHTGQDGSQVRDRTLREGYPFGAVGENIAQGQRTAQEAVQGWMRSPGHAANILRRQYGDVGFGFARGVRTGSIEGLYWCTVFGGGGTGGASLERAVADACPEPLMRHA